MARGITHYWIILCHYNLIYVLTNYKWLLYKDFTRNMLILQARIYVSKSIDPTSTNHAVDFASL